MLQYVLLVLEIALGRVTVEYAYGLAYLDERCGLERCAEVYVYAVVDDLRVVVEAEHLVAVDRYDDVRIPREVGTLYRHEVKRDIYAAVAHLADVGVGGLDLVAHVRGRRHLQQQILRVLLVEIYRERYAVVYHAEVYTQVVLLRCLPFEVGIGDVRGYVRRVGAGEGREHRLHRRSVLVRSDVVVAHQTVAKTQFQVRQHLRVAQELLVGDTPCEGCRGEEAPLVAGAELR